MRLLRIPLRRENLTQLEEPKDNQHCHQPFTLHELGLGSVADVGGRRIECPLHFRQRKPIASGRKYASGHKQMFTFHDFVFFVGVSLLAFTNAAWSAIV